jgi:hypothetical protein
MFGSGAPAEWARFLPDYGAGRVMVDGAFSPQLHAGGELALAGVWVLVVVAALLAALRYVVTGAMRTIPPRGT